LNASQPECKGRSFLVKEGGGTDIPHDISYVVRKIENEQKTSKPLYSKKNYNFILKIFLVLGFRV
jgi:hypothetical protein